MPRTVFLVLATVTLGLHCPLFAQPMVPTGPVQRPTISPYLNLLNRGGSPALNYLGIVRPQQQLAQQFGQLQQQANLANQAIDQAFTNEVSQLSSFLAPTGNVAVFHNTGNYFHRMGSAAYGPGLSGVGVGTGAGIGGFARIGGGTGAVGISQRPSFAGGYGAGGLSRSSGSRR